MRPNLNFAFVGICLLLATPAFATVSSVRGEPSKSTAKSSHQVASFRGFDPRSEAATTGLRLKAVTLDEVQGLRRENAARDRIEGHQARAIQIGLDRNPIGDAEVGSLVARWVPVNGGHVARIRIGSTGAMALRVGIKADAMSPGSEIRVASALPNAPIYRHAAAEIVSLTDSEGVFWTALTDGSLTEVEWFVPDSNTDPLPSRLPIAEVSHLLVTPSQQFDLTAVNPKNGGGCMINVRCRDGLGQEFRNAENSVARMVFRRSDGEFVCTGALLNDADPNSQKPYFLTAYHCLRNQEHANTLITFWELEAPTCSDTRSTPFTQVTGGAKYLYGAAETDVALLELNTAAPAGSYFAGWDAASFDANARGVEPVVGIHHPGGSLKSISEGSRTATRPIIYADGQPITAGFHGVAWSTGSGPTAPGSSGSPLFSVNGNDWRVRGTLIGGSSQCDNVGKAESAGNFDVYSRFDVIFPSLKAWLAGSTSSVTPTAVDPSALEGAWFVPAESGWGITIHPYGSGADAGIFVLWFVYDAQGKANWYFLQERWSSPGVVQGNLIQQENLGGWSMRSFAPEQNRRQVAGTARMEVVSDKEIRVTLNVGSASRTVTLNPLL